MLAILLACGLSPAAAQAQPAPAPSTPAPPPAAMPPEAPQDPYAPLPAADPDPRDDRAWTLYHRAFTAAAKGQSKEARMLLSELAEAYAGHPAAALASELMDKLAPGGSSASPGDSTSLRDVPDARAGERSELLDSGPRAELALAQAVHGIAVGIELCLFTDCNDAVALLGLGLLGGVGGFSGSLLATRDGLTSGQRALLNSGTLWGAYHGLMLLEITDPAGNQAQTLTVMSSHLLGLGAGAILSANSKSIDEGDVALANTFGIWSGVLSGMVMGLANIDDDDSALTALLVASDLGLIAGSVVASRYPMTRGRTLLIDAGGIVGALSGAGIAVLLSGNDTDQQLGFGATLLGTVIGLGSATYFSRSWGVDANPPARLTLMPVRDGLGAGVALDL